MRLLWTLRALVSGFLFLLVTLFLSVSAIVSTLLIRSQTLNRWHIKTWGRVTCFLFGVRVQVQGLQHWPREKGAVVLFNHTSFFDIFAMVGFLPDMRFGAKQELFRIPFFGTAMKQLGILPIDRSRRDKVFQIYESSTERLRLGEKIALAPEGGRLDQPEQIGAFKAGPFVFAMQAGVDLIPVVIHGAYPIMPKGSWLAGSKRKNFEIQLKVLQPISISEFSPETRSELQAQVRSQMQAGLESLLHHSPLV